MEGRARIEAAPADVFTYLSDLDNLAEWQSGVVSARRVDSGPMRVGSSARLTRDLVGQRLDVPLTVSEYEPPGRLGITTEASGVRVAAMLDLRPLDDGATDLLFAMEIRGSMLTSFMEPMIASGAEGDIAASLQRLKDRFSRPEGAQAPTGG